MTSDQPNPYETPLAQPCMDESAKVSGKLLYYARWVAFFVLCVIFGMGLLSLIVLTGRFPPSREYLGEEGYRSAWRTILLCGAILGGFMFGSVAFWYFFFRRRAKKVAR